MAAGTQIEVVMPQMGVSVSEGTVTKWLKQPGDAVALDEALLEISTDKVDTEVPSPGAGVVTEILVAEGETVEVGTVLAVIAAGRPLASGVRATKPAPALPRQWHQSHNVRSRSSTPATRATGARSSRRSSPGSPPSTGSTRT